MAQGKFQAMAGQVAVPTPWLL